MESELQIGLIALSVVGLFGIIAYNKWQERKHRKHAERAFRSEHRDVLLEPQTRDSSAGERLEPRADGDEADEGAEGAGGSRVQGYGRAGYDDEPGGRGDEPMSAVEASRPAGTASPSGRRSTPGVPESADPRVDCVIRIESIEPLQVARLWHVQQQELQGVDKAVRWYGFDDGENLWRALATDSQGAYHWFCAAMQMVDRRGAIDEHQFNEFSSGVQRVADQFLAVPSDVPTRAAALAGAAEMDRFCAKVDVQVGVNIVSKGTAFVGTKLRALAEAGGMTLGRDGAFHAHDDDGKVLFSLCNLENALFSENEMRHINTHGVTLLIDVPRVHDGVHVFDRMMRQANQMASTLDGMIVDDNRAAFGPEAAALIRSQIHQFQTFMANQSIPAGSPLASRLFSSK